MALTPRLELRQSQSLVMTPQLQQAIKLLQLTNLEVSAYVEEQIEQNPLLEHAGADGADAEGPGAEGSDGEAPAGVAGTADDAGNPTPDGEAPLPDGEPRAGGDEGASAIDSTIGDLDSDYDNMWNGDVGDEVPPPIVMEPWRGTGGSEGGGGIDHAPASAITLRDHLLAQLNVDLDDPVDRVIGAHLIDLLDDAGYINGELEPIAERLGCDVARVEAALDRLQRLEPTGVFARDLKECLALQLREIDHLDPVMATMLDNLDLLAGHEMAELKRRCDVDDEDFADMLAEIRGLDPKPGLAFGGEVAPTLVPDVIVRQHPTGDWVVELNNATLPRVLVNERYYTRVSKQATSRQDKEYISGCLATANWLVKSLAQRATTILRVGTELVRQQEAFLTHGVQHLRPLVLRDIAEAIGMHESTVSRVTANKYMMTPRGTFEMRYFFTTAIASSHGGGAAHSSEAVRHRIKALIDAESADKTLSDDDLTATLKGEGIDIARRTVAKYRETMNIPSSVRRRRLKRANLG